MCKIVLWCHVLSERDYNAGKNTRPKVRLVNVLVSPHYSGMQGFQFLPFDRQRLAFVDWERLKKIHHGVSELSDVLLDAILKAQMAYIPLIEINQSISIWLIDFF